MPRAGLPTEFSTPFTPQCALGPDFLYCTLGETQELVEEFNRNNLARVLLPAQSTARILHSFTAGHVGFLRRMLETLYARFKFVAADGAAHEDEIYQYLLSVEMVGGLAVSRGAPNYMSLTEDARGMLDALLRYGHVTIDVNNVQQLTIVHYLMKRYIVRWTNDECHTICFICPAIERMTFSALISSTRPLSDPGHDLGAFLIKCLERMRVDFLENNLGVGADKLLLERAWQMEMYRAATAVLPAEFHISPDVGRLFGTEGKVDFYVNGVKRWLVELTRNGDRLQEHAKRFDPKGLYGTIPYKERAILDFRVSRPNDATIAAYGDLVWFVIYDSSFKHATILHAGEETLVQFYDPRATADDRLRQIFSSFTKEDIVRILNAMNK